MADQKISQLPTITGANMADNDKFVLVDTSGDATVATTRAEFFKSVPDVTFGDNDKAIFGAGSDLQIYHDGSDSYITDTGTGSLIVRASDTIKLQAHTGELYFQGIKDGAVKLYYDNAETLITTSTGVDVTGTVTSDGLTIANTGIPQFLIQDLDGTSQRTFYKQSNGATSITAQDGTSHGRTLIQSYNGTDTVNRLRADANGDISFYEDTGTTPKFFWDASAESLTVGSTQLNYNATKVQTGSGTATSAGFNVFTSATGDGYLLFSDGNVGNQAYVGQVRYNHAGDFMAFSTAGPERMRIDSSGNVGIGTSSPSNKFVVAEGTNQHGIELAPGTTSYIQAYDRATSDYGDLKIDAQTIAFGTDNGTERMRIDSDGNVGIGTDDPESALDIIGANQDAIKIRSSIGSDEYYQIGRNQSSGVLEFKASEATYNGYLFRGDSSDLMYIKNDGNVGIGTNDPDRNLDLVGSENVVYGTTVRASAGVNHRIFNTVNANSRYAGITLAANNSAESTSEFTISNVSTTSNNKGVLTFQASTGASTYAERMRIDKDGNVGIGTNDPSAYGGQIVSYQTTGAISSAVACVNSATTGTARQIDFFRGASTARIGSIESTPTSVSYNTSSDYRLKTDAQPMTGATERVQELNPVNFEWIANGSRVDGFLAHEAQEVVPESVTGERDAMRDEEYEVTPEVLDDDGNVTTEAVMGTRSVPDYQGIDQSKLVPLLTAALQEALTEIASLKSRVEALEG